MTRAKILEHMAALYGTRTAAGLSERLEEMVGRQPMPESARRARPLTERDAILITYGDQIRAPGEVPLRTLGASGRRWWRDLVSAVHLLPFYPYSSDDSFSRTRQNPLPALKYPHIDFWNKLTRNWEISRRNQDFDDGAIYFE